MQSVLRKKTFNYCYNLFEITIMTVEKLIKFLSFI